MPRHPVEHRVDVVDRDQHLRQVVAIVGRDEHGKRRDEQRRADVLVALGIADRLADRGVAKAVARRLELQARGLVNGGAQPGAVGRPGAVDLGRWHVGGVQARAVRRVDRALEHLRPVARDVHLDDADARFARRRPGRRLEFAHRLARTHPDPEEAAAFAYRIGLVLLPEARRRARGFRGHVEHTALDIELPAVIQAAQAALLVAAEGERSAAVQAVLAKNSEAALRVPEDHQVLAEQARSHRRPILVRGLLGHADRQPVAPHDLPHRRAALDAAQQFILLAGQHRISLGS